jgi:transcriptional regulator with XRE-family HTH domain
MTLGEKLRHLRYLEGNLRGFERELTQTEVVQAIKAELNASLSQSYLSLIENGTRPHLSNQSRQLLAKFFKVHPGYLVDDPPGFQTELSSPLAPAEDALDSWLLDGSIRFGNDTELSDALDRIAGHPDSRACVRLLGEIASIPGFVERLSHALLRKEPA